MAQLAIVGDAPVPLETFGAQMDELGLFASATEAHAEMRWLRNDSQRSLADHFAFGSQRSFAVLLGDDDAWTSGSADVDKSTDANQEIADGAPVGAVLKDFEGGCANAGREILSNLSFSADLAYQDDAQLSKKKDKQYHENKKKEMFVYETIEAYCSEHMGIAPNELKLTALARIQDLARLFVDLAHDGAIRLEHPPEGEISSVFGFHRLHVSHAAKFCDAIASLVVADKSRCWRVNGKRTLLHPASPCYEVLRQLGIHPVKGTRLPRDDGMRSAMSYSEFRFSASRMRVNCLRLKIGAIGNRRT